jgi:hypothetical protein
MTVETFVNVRALEWLEMSRNYVRIVDIELWRVLPKLSTF